MIYVTLCGMICSFLRLLLLATLGFTMGLCGQEAAAGKTFTAKDQGEFKAAMAAANAGDTIIVAFDADGLDIRGKSGTPGKFITIKADRQLGRSTKTITIKDCQYLAVEGFKIAGFASHAVKVVGSHHLVLTRNLIDFTGIAAANGIYTSGGSIHDIEISYNEFNHHVAAGKWAGSYIKTWFDGTDVAKRLWIHHNCFANVAPQVDEKRGRPGNPFSGDSDREAIIFGEGASQNLETEHLIEMNVFEDCDGEDEFISFKTSKNVFRHNTIRNCMGSVHIRFGHGSEIHGNVFTGDVVTDFSDAAYTAHANYESSGVVVYGTDHKVYNNHFENLTGGRKSKHRLPIVLDSGDTDETTGNEHQRPKGVLIAHNTLVNCQYGIGVGLNYKLPPQNCVIANNLLVGKANVLFRMSADSESDTTCTYAGNIAWAVAPCSDGTEKVLIKKDPLLRAASLNGWTLSVLTAESPAINASVGREVKDDVFGGTRQDQPDVGAQEFGAKMPWLPMQRAQVGPAAE